MLTRLVARVALELLRQDLGGIRAGLLGATLRALLRRSGQKDLQLGVGRDDGADVTALGDVVAVTDHVAPDAELKVFLTASPEARAQRRAAQTGADPAQVLAEQLERDERDSTREHSPLAPAGDALRLDTTGLSVDEVVGRIAQLVQAVR